MQNLPGFTPERIRAELLDNPSITTPFGERRVTYADYVASGRALRWIEDRIQSHVLPMYANTHTEDSATGAHSTHLAHWAGEYIKNRLGAPHYKIVFCGTGSTAAIKRLQEILGLAVPSNLRERTLATLAPHERPVVFVGPYEHHSNEVSWRESLAEVIELPLCPRGLLDLDALRAALGDPRFANRPKIGSFSAASNVTGILSDTRTVARMLHRHGALAFFDFAASAPYVDINMRPGQDDGCDAVFISAHKFVGGPGTPGILVFNPDLYKQNAPSTAGGGTVSYVSRFAHQFVGDIEAREDAGTPAIVQKIRAALAFAVKDAIGSKTIHALEQNFIRQAIARLRHNPRLELLGNLDAPRLAVLSFLVKTDEGQYLHPRFVVRLLNDLFGIQARGGCACAGPYGHALLHISDQESNHYQQAILAGYEGIKPGWSRLNFNYFIDQNEFEFLLCALEFIAQHGEHFVGQYDFDWRSGAWTHPHDQTRTPNALAFFANDATPPNTNPTPFAQYLEAAHTALANLTSNTEHPKPQAIAPELVFFKA